MSHLRFTYQKVGATTSSSPPFFSSPERKRYWRISGRAVIFAAQAIAACHLFFRHVGEWHRTSGPSMLPTLGADGDLVIAAKLPFLSFVESVRRNLGLDSRYSSTLALPAAGWKTKSSKMDRACGLPIRVGDIVVSASPNDPDRLVCKRILGLPGDTVFVDPRVSVVSTATASHDVGQLLQKSKTSPSDAQTMSTTPSTTQSGISSATVVSPVTVDKDDDEDADAHLYITVPAGHVWLAGDNISNSTDSRHYGPVPMGCLRSKIVAQVSGMGCSQGLDLRSLTNVTCAS